MRTNSKGKNMAEKRYDITRDPEANVLFEKCSQVDAALWAALAAADPREVQGRTGVRGEGGVYHLPFLNRILAIQPAVRQSHMQGREGEDPSFQLCLAALLYLMKVDAADLGSRQASPKEFRGGTTFFQGPHALPVSRLEERFGNDREGFLTAGLSLGGEVRPLGDAAVALTAFPGLTVEVILWLADEEFDAQVNLTITSGIEKFWALDGVWALLNVVTRELWRAG